MANTVRFYDGGTVSSSIYTGRWVWHVDPFTVPGGTDGQFFELDFVVDDPADSSRVFWGYVGGLGTDPPSTVTGGLTFDSAAPPAWVDYATVFRTTKAAYDSYAAGATTRPHDSYYDGTYAIFDLATSTSVDAASDPDWYGDVVLPPAATPVITSPVDGTTYTLDDDTLFALTWTETGQTHAEVEVIGGVPYSPNVEGFDWGSFAGGSTITVRYPHAGTLTFRVRAKTGTDTDWSDWAESTITITPNLDTPLDCFEDEVMLDSPVLFWMDRQIDGAYIDDLSGNADPATKLGGASLFFNGGFDHDASSFSYDGSLEIGSPAGSDPGDVVALWLHVDAWGTTVVPSISATGWTVELFLDGGDVSSGFAHPVSVLMTRINDGASSWFIDIATGEPSPTYFYAYASWSMRGVEQHPSTDSDVTLGAVASTGSVGGSNGQRGEGAILYSEPTGNFATRSGPGATGWMNATSDFNGEAAIAAYVLAQDFRYDNAVTWTRSFSGTWPMLVASAFWPSTLDEIPETDHGACDDECADVNYGVTLTSDSYERMSSDATILDGLSEFTILLLARIDASVGECRALFGGSDIGSTDSTSIKFDLDSGRSRVSLSVSGDNGIGSWAANGFEGAPLRRWGCWNIAGLTFKDATSPHVKFWANGVFLGDAPSDPGPVSSPDFDVRTFVDGYSSTFGALIVIPAALSARRLYAYAAHLCRCPGLGGWKVGRAGFPSG